MNKISILSADESSSPNLIEKKYDIKKVFDEFAQIKKKFKSIRENNWKKN